MGIAERLWLVKRVVPLKVNTSLSSELNTPSGKVGLAVPRTLQRRGVLALRKALYREKMGEQRWYREFSPSAKFKFGRGRFCVSLPHKMEELKNEIV